MNEPSNECRRPSTLSLSIVMSHQDWTDVVFKKPSKNKVTPHFERSKEQKIETESEELTHKKVGVSLGKQIQNARIAKGFKTQKDLATAINVRPEVINSYECGKAIPDNAIMQKLRRVLNTQLKV